MTLSPRHRFILAATGVYGVLALLWVFLSEQLLHQFADSDALDNLATARGIFLVLVTAMGLFFTLHAVPAPRAEPSADLLKLFAGNMVRDRWPRWLTHVFAVAITLAMLLVREYIAAQFGNRPLLILFMLPIVVSALLGGLWPGLLSTATAAAGVAYFVIPPLHSFRIAADYDLAQWTFLIINGIAVSLLSEVLRRALAKAEVSRRLLDTIVSGTPDAVFAKDRQGRYLLANTAAAGFVGKPPAAILGHDDRQLFPAPSAEEVMAMDREIMAANAPQSREEHVTTLDGRHLVFLVTKGPMFDQEGRSIGLFGIGHEITNRKQAENEIRRLNAELEQRVAERTAELQSANLELEELAYAMTHNLRAPLRAIDGFSYVLVEDHGAGLDDGARGCLAQMTQASRDMGRMLDGILTLLRCTRGELQREAVDVSALARRLLEELAAAEPERQVAGEVAPDLTLSGDAAMLEVVLAHLLRNAWKFTRNRAGATIRVAAGDIDGHPGICIIDNGIGFDMAHAEHLFLPFQRLHRQDEFPGLGIGLATVQRIVHRHGGRIRARGEPGAGATFCLSLPPPPAASETP